MPQRSLRNCDDDTQKASEHTGLRGAVHRPTSVSAFPYIEDRLPQKRRVVLACQPALGRALKDVIRAEFKRGSRHNVALRTTPLSHGYGLLAAGEADILIGLRATDDPRGVPSEAFETMDLGVDNLIPVARPDLDIGRSGMPLVAYPREVMPTEVLDRHQRGNPEKWVTTALCSSALDLALAGVGVSWVPQMLAQKSLNAGKLRQHIDLRNQELIITAIRVAGSQTVIQQKVWDRLSSIEMGN